MQVYLYIKTLFQISCFEKNFSQDFLFRLNMSSPDALRYHNLMRHPDLAPIHTLVSPSKATASAPTSPIKKIAAISPIQHKRLSLPNNIEEVRMSLKRVRVKVMREVEMLKDVGRAALEERLAESPKKVPHPEKTSLEETRSENSSLLTKEGFLEDLLDGVVDNDVKQEKPSLLEILTRILDHLEVLDRGGLFKEPVDLEETPDYLDCIACPMDFSTMRKKVEAEEYSSIDEIEEDFMLVVSNC